MTPDLKQQFQDFLFRLQKDITEAISTRDGNEFLADKWERKIEGGTVVGLGNTMVLKNGVVIEQGGVNVSVVSGNRLPDSASANKPHLAGQPFEAIGLSLVLHPRNPFVPTTHANIRLIIVKDPENHNRVIDWWFGGGFDLTPYYIFEDDIRHWHQCAYDACQPFGDELYPKFKTWCDEYFYLPHRKETRGIGGIFFDDFNDRDFSEALAFTSNVGSAFIDAYIPILEKRKNTPYSELERNFQAYRRGRYVEFNLIYDRGTFFGLKSGFRVESILMSLPPHVKFEYNYEPSGERERELTHYLQPMNWIRQ